MANKRKSKKTKVVKRSKAERFFEDEPAKDNGFNMKSVFDMGGSFFD